MLQGKRILRAFAVAALLLSTVSGSAFAAKAPDPDDTGYVCFPCGVKAGPLTDVAAEFKQPILAALEKSISRKTSPPFVPVALFGDEPVHDPILHSRIGSYWNIIIGYTMASGIFPPGSEEESWIAHYQEQHGGLCMGMLRAGGGQFNFWTSDNRINPLDLLRLDQLSARVPVPPAGGALRLRAKEVLPEIVPGSLQLHVTYEFLPDR